MLITDAPDVLYFEDTNADGKADIRKVVLTGFAFTNPQHTVNNPVYGLDNWIYLAHEGPAGAVIFGDLFGDLLGGVPERPLQRHQSVAGELDQPATGILHRAVPCIACLAAATQRRERPGPLDQGPGLGPVVAEVPPGAGRRERPGRTQRVARQPAIRRQVVRSAEPTPDIPRPGQKQLISRHTVEPFAFGNLRIQCGHRARIRLPVLYRGKVGQIKASTAARHDILERGSVRGLAR